MTNCPKCGSSSLSSNKRKDVEFGEIAGDVFNAARLGWMQDALSDVVTWGALKAANALRNPHKCDHCLHTF